MRRSAAKLQMAQDAFDQGLLCNCPGESSFDDDVCETVYIIKHKSECEGRELLLTLIGGKSDSE